MKHVSHYGRLDRHTGTGGLGQGEQAGDSPGDGDALAHAEKIVTHSETLVNVSNCSLQEICY